jgi:hypothetical protein
VNAFAASEPSVVQNWNAAPRVNTARKMVVPHTSMPATASTLSGVQARSSTTTDQTRTAIDCAIRPRRRSENSSAQDWA